MSGGPITIYLLIGVAHWAAHTLVCGSCKEWFRVSGDYLLEALMYIFGWPIQTLSYVAAIAKKPRTGLTEDDVLNQVRASLEKFLSEGNIGNAQITEITMQPGESKEDFFKRVLGKIKDIEKEKEGQKHE